MGHIDICISGTPARNTTKREWINSTDRDNKTYLTTCNLKSIIEQGQKNQKWAISVIFLWQNLNFEAISSQQCQAFHQNAITRSEVNFLVQNWNEFAFESDHFNSPTTIVSGPWTALQTLHWLSKWRDSWHSP